MLVAFLVQFKMENSVKDTMPLAWKFAFNATMLFHAFVFLVFVINIMSALYVCLCVCVSVERYSWLHGPGHIPIKRLIESKKDTPFEWINLCSFFCHLISFRLFARSKPQIVSKWKIFAWRSETNLIHKKREIYSQNLTTRKCSKGATANDRIIFYI